MLAHLSLRLRVFLFFVLLGGGSVVITLASVYLGYQRLGEPEALSAFLFSGVVSTFLILGLTAGIWLLFDENVAKAVERLAAQIRAGAHAGVSSGFDEDCAKYLGDLAPAAKAMTKQLSSTALDTAQAVADETARLEAEKTRLTALLSDIPIAVVLVNPAHQIVLYDGQAADLLALEGPARLNASLFDYFDAAAIKTALADLAEGDEARVSFTANSRSGREFDAVIRTMGSAKGYMITLEPQEEVTAHLAPEAARPLVYDFDLIDRPKARDLHSTPLDDLCFVVFDTETTGLLPHQDEIVQIGAVRMLKGRIIEGEAFESLVNPGRPIPPASTKVHHVTDAMVADAPDIGQAGAEFHHFARDAVLVAHNAPFDMAFLHRHKDRIGRAFDHPVLDTVLLSAVLFGGSDEHTLDALCTRLGITIPAELRHTAMGDAVATAEVLVKMLPMLQARGFSTFGEVLGEVRKHQRIVEDLNS